MFLKDSNTANHADDNILYDCKKNLIGVQAKLEKYFFMLGIWNLTQNGTYKRGFLSKSSITSLDREICQEKHKVNLVFPPELYNYST